MLNYLQDIVWRFLIWLSYYYSYFDKGALTIGFTTTRWTLLKFLVNDADHLSYEFELLGLT